MTVPGVNLLAMAAGLIGQQAVAYQAFAGVSTNAAGQVVATWAEPTTVYGSVQPVDHTLLQQYGLDLTKSYVTFWSSRMLGEPTRDRTGDRLTYAGRVYQVESATPWYAQDGWSRALCVEVTNAAA